MAKKQPAAKTEMGFTADEHINHTLLSLKKVGVAFDRADSLTTEQVGKLSEIADLVNDIRAHANNKIGA